jgi:hypothetical protein
VTLRVDYVDFADSVIRLTGKREAYWRTIGDHIRLSAADPHSGAIVRSVTTQEFAKVRRALESENFLLLPGEWSDESDTTLDVVESVVGAVAAVAYETSGHRAGLWMDAYPNVPTEMEVLATMHEELTQNGEITPVTFDKFAEDLNGNVVVLTNIQIRGYLAAKLVPKPEKATTES